MTVPDHDCCVPGDGAIDGCIRVNQRHTDGFARAPEGVGGNVETPFRLCQIANTHGVVHDGSNRAADFGHVKPWLHDEGRRRPNSRNLTDLKFEPLDRFNRTACRLAVLWRDNHRHPAIDHACATAIAQHVKQDASGTTASFTHVNMWICRVSN